MLEAIPVIDGSEIDWSSFGPQRIHTIILWIIVIVLMLVALRFFHYEKISHAISILSICLTFMLLTTLIVLCISNYGWESKGDGVVTDDSAFTFSQDENFIILVLDAVDGNTLIDLWTEEYDSALQDFTRYDNCMCAYPYTELCVPFLFSDRYFENDISYRTYYANAFTKSRFLNTLEDSGYRMGLYEPEAVINDPGMYRFENIKQDPLVFSSLKEIVKIQIKLTGMRYMPYDLKRFCQVMPGDVPRLRKHSLGISDIKFYGSDMAFYNALKERNISYSDTPCFRFLHIEGAHVPYRYDEFVNEIPEEQGTYEDNIKASMTITLSFLEKLKQSDVYDNSAIIIMSDHGYNRYEYNAATGRQHSILLVKGRNEHHSGTQVSMAPVAHEDFQSACLKLLSGASGSDIFEAKEGDKRERRYLLFYYNGTVKNDGLHEYIQTANADNMDTLRATGRVYK